ncbi:MAG: hypothetical protein R3F59_02105 [Myxococcota bacterium]
MAKKKPTALRFPGAEAVRVALSLVPADVQAAGGTVAREPDGALVVTAVLPAAARDALVQAGAEAVREPDEAAPFAHWAELVPLEPDDDPDLREILFLLPPEAPWLPLAAELVRLGCDAVELTRLDRDDWALRARRPPFYTVARAATGDWAAYARQRGAPVWVEAGFRHPLADQLDVEADTLLLLDRRGWRTVRPAAWTELLERLELHLPPPVEAAAQPPTERLVVHLRLKPAPRAATPTLWRVGDAERIDAVLDGLLAVLPHNVVERLLFARYTLPDGTPGALLRARPGSAPPLLEGVVPYAPHPQLPAVHVPAGRTVDPPLHARTLARLLDPGPGAMSWLESAPDGTDIRVHRIAEDAFQPLQDWVVYHADRDDERVRAWMGSAVFDWEPLDLPIHADPRPKAPREEAPRRAEPVRAAPVPEPDEAPVVAERAPATLLPVLELAPIPETAPASELELRLHQLQVQLVADPERVDLWVPMAELHHALGQPRDAGLCWTRALWDQPPAERKPFAERWVALLPEAEGDLLVEDPHADALYAVLAHLLAEDLAFDPPALQRWLEANDAQLDVRGRWLASAAALPARRRRRARPGPRPRRGAGVHPQRPRPVARRPRLPAHLDERRGAAPAAGQPREPARPPGAAGAPDVPKQPSRVYARLTVAWAEACLGLDEPVRAALADAEQTLPLEDAIHRVLLGLYRSGIEEASPACLAETPPPREVVAQLEALEPFDRYRCSACRTSRWRSSPRPAPTTPSPTGSTATAAPPSGPCRPTSCCPPSAPTSTRSTPSSRARRCSRCSTPPPASTRPRPWPSSSRSSGSPCRSSPATACRCWSRRRPWRRRCAVPR